ncbi:hypothetical protein NIES4071_07590 [Calothrix sp. NIES-4071]|nr:hypothetical protein NIES4071_07590 [Calothrix sp. NIES-4071]BAZ55101.1 hypothetical protein NIES4105_07550 [Calothrix sp. NIES-4105]
MTTVAIQPIQDESGKRYYRAVAGNKQSVGKTAGQALDALTTQLGETEFNGVLLLQSFRPDQFFNIEQQKRLSQLMELWREARDKGESLPEELQAELDSLVEAELNAATNRTVFLMQQQSE